MPEAGWYTDPAGSEQHRWWDGAKWTNILRPPSAPAEAELTAPPSAPEPTARGPSAISTPAPTAPAPAPDKWETTDAAPLSHDDASRSTTTPDRRQPTPASRLRVWHLAAVAFVALILGFLLGKAGNKSSSTTAATATTAASPSFRAPSTTVNGSVTGAATGSPSTTSPAHATTVAPKQTTYAVGQTASTSGWNVTVFAVHNPQTPATVTPGAGKHYVSVDVQVTNAASQSATWSGLVGFHLLDAQNHQYDIEITDITPKAPDGPVPAGGRLRGLAVFTVPNATTGALRLQVQASPTAGGAIFNLS